MNYKEYIELMEDELGELDLDDYDVAKSCAEFDYYSDKINRML